MRTLCMILMATLLGISTLMQGMHVHMPADSSGSSIHVHEDASHNEHQPEESPTFCADRLVQHQAKYHGYSASHVTMPIVAWYVQPLVTAENAVPRDSFLLAPPLRAPPLLAS